MAMRVVELTEEELQQSGKRFEKFEAIGDIATGVLVKRESVTKTFKAEEGPRTFDAYTFYGPKRGDAKAPLIFEISPLPFDLERKMKKALRPIADGGMGLEPGKGHLVQMKFSSTMDTGQASPMKVFTLAVDTEFKPQKPLPADVVWAVKSGGSSSSAGAAQAKPPPEDDDIPF